MKRIKIFLILAIISFSTFFLLVGCSNREQEFCHQRVWATIMPEYVSHRQWTASDFPELSVYKILNSTSAGIDGVSNLIIYISNPSRRNILRARDLLNARNEFGTVFLSNSNTLTLESFLMANYFFQILR